MTFTEYEKEIENAKPAEAMVYGALRGGWLLNGYFLFCSRGYNKMSVSECSELREV